MGRGVDRIYRQEGSGTAAAGPTLAVVSVVTSLITGHVRSFWAMGFEPAVGLISWCCVPRGVRITHPLSLSAPTGSGDDYGASQWDQNITNTRQMSQWKEPSHETNEGNEMNNIKKMKRVNVRRTQ